MRFLFFMLPWCARGYNNSAWRRPGELGNRGSSFFSKPGGRMLASVNLSCILLAAVTCCGLASFAWTAAGAADLVGEIPRYRWKVGQELTYTQSSEFK